MTETQRQGDEETSRERSSYTELRLAQRTRKNHDYLDLIDQNLKKINKNQYFLINMAPYLLYSIPRLGSFSMFQR